MSVCFILFVLLQSGLFTDYFSFMLSAENAEESEEAEGDEGEENDVYAKLGFTSGALPATVIVNREGEIVFKKEGSMNYEALEEVLLSLMKY